LAYLYRSRAHEAKGDSARAKADHAMAVQLDPSLASTTARVK
jgi:hypothetical protein